MHLKELSADGASGGSSDGGLNRRRVVRTLAVLRRRILSTSIVPRFGLLKRGSGASLRRSGKANYHHG